MSLKNPRLDPSDGDEDMIVTPKGEQPPKFDFKTFLAEQVKKVEQLKK